MARYIIGDIHGCYDEFVALLKKLSFNPRTDSLFLTGDVIARGCDSLKVVHLLYELGKSCQMVLGNHDIHFLAVALGIKRVNERDALGGLLKDGERERLVDFFRSQPLFMEIEQGQQLYLLAHAGLNPAFATLQAVRNYAKFAQQSLQSHRCEHFLQSMYDPNPQRIDEAVTDEQKFRLSVNSFTRMRYVDRNYTLDLQHKTAPNDNENSHLMPWFEADEPLIRDHTIAFGHWATLVDYQTPANILALDTGCVWGRHLTAYCLETGRYVIQNKL